jgi:hemerythrin
MQWDPTVEMGVPEIDEQHRDILRRLDALIHAVRQGYSRDEVGRTLAFLREHVTTHFTAEEKLMRAVAFPALAEHQAEHDGFVRDLADLEAEHERHGASPSLVLRVSGHVTEWLREHLFGSDRKLAQFLRARG